MTPTDIQSPIGNSPMDERMKLVIQALMGGMPDFKMPENQPVTPLMPQFMQGLQGLGARQRPVTGAAGVGQLISAMPQRN